MIYREHSRPGQKMRYDRQAGAETEIGLTEQRQKAETEIRQTGQRQEAKTEIRQDREEKQR